MLNSLLITTKEISSYLLILYPKLKHLLSSCNSTKACGNQVIKTFLVHLSKTVFFSLSRLVTCLIQVKIFSDPLTLTMKIGVHNVFMITMKCLYNLVVCMFQEVDREDLTLKRKDECGRVSLPLLI